MNRFDGMDYILVESLTSLGSLRNNLLFTGTLTPFGII